MHKKAKGHTHLEIVKQVKNKEPSVKDYAFYIPIKKAAKKISNWKKEGAEIIYLTSRKKRKEILFIQRVLKKYKFPSGQLLFRQKKEEYKDVAERILPDILIEDDCESIGGKEEIISTKVQPKLKKKIKSIVVKEFKGIDHLSNKINDLKEYQN